MDKVPLAHSARNGVEAETYLRHVAEVVKRAKENAARASAFYSGNREEFIEWVKAAAVYHDLGKLDKANQHVLAHSSRNPLPIAHEDAGVAELDKLGRQEALVMVQGHHSGLFSRQKEMAKRGRRFRQLDKVTPEGEKVADHVDSHIADYEAIHQETGCPCLVKVEPKELGQCGLTRRIALSCLVDADYGDTACHYGQETDLDTAEPRWLERLEALQKYVNKLPEGDAPREQERNRLRKSLYEACFNAPLEPPIRTCDAPVGTGKTTAIMAHLLRVAKENKLRHIIIVLPYTNIITQSVEIYRKALILNGEQPEDIVAEHHHRADFDNLELRQLATLWKAPIIVTTAVQFFETLGSNIPSRLRKLHELPGSAIFVDEMHASMPAYLWPQMWRWLEIGTRNWGMHLVLASGSLPRFWELDEYRKVINNTNSTFTEIPDLVTDNTLHEQLTGAEKQRICIRRRPDAPALNLEGIIDFTIKKPGPRLLIVNTVQTAAVIARAMRDAGHDVLHLSTALVPAHRDLIVELVKQKLREKIEDWTLVATSCVEAGMNFSFRTGIRERASTASLIQIGGRISRGDEFENAEVWDILLRDDKFRTNPAMDIPRSALDGFNIEELNGLHPAKLATLAMEREWNTGAEDRANELITAEQKMEYPSVSKQCQVINADTRTVVIDKSLAQSIKRGERISKVELLRYSVQIWANKIDKLSLEPILANTVSDTLYEWPYSYDPDFLGYMEGVLKIEDFISAGGAVI